MLHDALRKEAEQVRKRVHDGGTDSEEGCARWRLLMSVPTGSMGMSLYNNMKRRRAVSRAILCLTSTLTHPVVSSLMWIYISFVMCSTNCCGFCATEGHTPENAVVGSVGALSCATMFERTAITCSCASESLNRKPSRFLQLRHVHAAWNERIPAESLLRAVRPLHSVEDIDGIIFTNLSTAAASSSFARASLTIGSSNNTQYNVLIGVLTVASAFFAVCVADLVGSDAERGNDIPEDDANVRVKHNGLRDDAVDEHVHQQQVHEHLVVGATR